MPFIKDYTKQAENFIYGEALADGIKTSLAIIIPPIVAGLFGHLYIGVTMSLGAILSHMTDTPGPLKERRNYFWISVLLIFCISYLTKSINHQVYLLGFILVIVVFCSNMLTVYGQRASALGMVIMMSMVMNMNTLRDNFDPLVSALLISSGAAWYTLFSLAISTFRPYRLAQQNLSECMLHVAEYIRIKTMLFEQDTDEEETIKKLLNEQVLVNEKQVIVRELVFTNKKLVKDTTKIGRSIVFSFSDLIDIFENITANHYDYEKIKEEYGSTKAIRQIIRIMNKIANELSHIAFHINANKRPKNPSFNYDEELEKLNSAIKELYDEGQKPIVLSKIYVTIKQVLKKLSFIHRFLYDEGFDKIHNPLDHAHRFTKKNKYTLKKLKDHLNIKSPIFRHALRSAIVISVAYGISFILPMTYHSYWMLMTVLVILKPGFSVTKKRNLQRVKGTLFGGVIGITILLVFKSEAIRFSFMLFFMLMAYTFLRHKYAIGTLYLTAYILLSFSFVSQIDSIEVIQERFIDTLIGGFIAFISSYIILPTWEKENMNDYLQKSLIANYNFLYVIFKKLADNEVTTTQYKLARKDVYIEMANVTSVFQRLISEPKDKQQFANELNRFTIFNHSFVSYSTGLANIMKKKNSVILTSEHIRLMKKSLQLLAQTIRLYGDFETENTLKSIEFQEKAMIYSEMESEKQQSDSEFILEMIEYIHEIIYDFMKISHIFNDKPKK